MTRLIRVFPRITKATPRDDLARFGPPTLLDEADEVHVSVTFSQDTAIASADVVHVIWDGKSQGCLFDLGVAFALKKKLEIVLIPALTDGKSFQNMMAAWACGGLVVTSQDRGGVDG